MEDAGLALQLVFYFFFKSKQHTCYTTAATATLPFVDKIKGQSCCQPLLLISAGSVATSHSPQSHKPALWTSASPACVVDEGVGKTSRLYWRSSRSPTASALGFFEQEIVLLSNVDTMLSHTQRHRVQSPSAEARIRMGFLIIFYWHSQHKPHQSLEDEAQSNIGWWRWCPR